MIKRILLIIIVIAVAIVVGLFTSANTGTVEIDLLLASVTTSLPIAFTIAFGFGWIFGLLCLSLWAFRLTRERRMLKRALSASETEVSSLRSLPLSDAD